jgi:SM-20-related protein
MIRQLAEQGFAIVDEVLPPDQLLALQQSALRILAVDAKLAGTGRGQDHALNAGIRQDHIVWLDASDAASAGFLAHMEQVRLLLNQQLFLGLFSYECHFACYQPGAFYRKHLDAFKGGRNRRLSTVFYLNSGWLPAAGGELLIYRSDGEVVATKVPPLANRLVLFLSEEFPHEVLPATRQRLSVTGWFRGA